MLQVSPFLSRHAVRYTLLNSLIFTILSSNENTITHMHHATISVLVCIYPLSMFLSMFMFTYCVSIYLVLLRCVHSVIQNTLFLWIPRRYSILTSIIFLSLLLFFLFSQLCQLCRIFFVSHNSSAVQYHPVAFATLSYNQILK